MNMVKRSKVPSGFYSAKEAAEHLNMPIASFYRRVREGKIQKEVPPGATEGFYEKKVIDKLAQERALFTLLHSIEPITFRRAESEEDIRGIVDLCIAIYGQGGTPSYDARYEIWQKNPEVYYIVKQEGIVVGYISLIWFDDVALNVLMGPTSRQAQASSAGTGVYSTTGPEHVLPFIPGQPIESLFISLGVRPGFTNTEQRDYAFKLMRGTQDTLVNFAQRGMEVHKLYATSERGEGIRLARKLGMKEIKYPGDPLLRYELDVETSDNMLLQPYKKALAARREQSK
jgi:hypothetical protein